MTVSSLAEAVAAVPDPELPHVTIGDLGIVRRVQELGGAVEVTITPTYSGCPATEVIGSQILEVLHALGVEEATVSVELSPTWTSDWITEEGRRKLRDAGITPPGPAPDPLAVSVELTVRCPRCDSRRTQRLSAFGSTPCKAPYRCLECLEPYEHFKAF